MIQKSDFYDELSETDLVGVFETGESSIELTWVRNLCVFSTVSELLEEMKKQGAPQVTVLVESERIRKAVPAFLEVMEMNPNNRAYIVVSNEPGRGKCLSSELDSLVASVTERVHFIDQELLFFGKSSPQKHGSTGEKTEISVFLRELHGYSKVFSENSEPEKGAEISHNRLRETLRRLYPVLRKWTPAKVGRFAIILLRRVETIKRSKK